MHIACKFVYCTFGEATGPDECIVEGGFHFLNPTFWDDVPSLWGRGKNALGWVLSYVVQLSWELYDTCAFPCSKLIYFLDEKWGQMFFRACHCVPIELPPLFSPSPSFTHVAAFSFGGSQKVDKASVKWDLAGTWTKLAGMVGDIIWKWHPVLRHGQKGLSKGAGGGSGTAQCHCMIDVSRECEGDRTRLSSSDPRLRTIPVFLCETLHQRLARLMLLQLSGTFVITVIGETETQRHRRSYTLNTGAMSALPGSPLCRGYILYPSYALRRDLVWLVKSLVALRAQRRHPMMHRAIAIWRR